MSCIVLTKENFEQEVLRSDRPILVDFGAEWCGPCRAMAPVIEDLAAEQTAVKVGKVDIDLAPELAAQYWVTNIPTLILFREGETAGRVVGRQSREQILAMINGQRHSFREKNS